MTKHMKKTKHIVLLGIFCAISGQLMAQEEVAPAGKIREVYLSTSSLTNLIFSVQYKQQLKGSEFLKIGFTNLFMSRNEMLPSNTGQLKTATTNLNGGTVLGLEFRKDLGSRLTLFQGPNVQ